MEKASKPKQILSKSAEKSLPFFKTLKKCTKKSDFQWTAKAEAAFKEMKKLIAELPTLTAPMENEELIVYLAAAREAVIAVLMTEREAKQIPVYFVSHALARLTQSCHSGPTNLSMILSKTESLEGFAENLGGTSEDDSLGHAHGANENFWTLDAVHGRIILRRWFRSWSDTYKSGRSRIHLRSEIQVRRNQ
ncbi:reverse transcriptase domain-containing protein [Tanacetum coccineum]